MVEAKTGGKYGESRLEGDLVQTVDAHRSAGVWRPLPGPNSAPRLASSSSSSLSRSYAAIRIFAGHAVSARDAKPMQGMPRRLLSDLQVTRQCRAGNALLVAGDGRVAEHALSAPAGWAWGAGLKH